MLIDIHAHVYRKPTPIMAPPFCSAEELLAYNDRLGIDIAFLLPIVNAEMYFPQSNEDIVEIAQQYPDRFVPFCNIDPRAMRNNPNSPLDKALQYYKDMGCKGVGEVMPNMDLLDPKVQNLFYCAEKVGLPVTYDGSVEHDGDFGLYDDPGLPQLECTLQRFPKLTIFGHGPVFWSEIAKLETIGERGVFHKFQGGQVVRLPDSKIKEEGTVPKLLRKYPNLMCDLSDCTAYNALTRDEDYIVSFIEEFGDRMFFGTDVVAPTMEVPLIGTLERWLKEGKISKANYNKITHENAMKMFDL